jgi:hypothetical protein
MPSIVMAEQNDAAAIREFISCTLEAFCLPHCAAVLLPWLLAS